MEVLTTRFFLLLWKIFKKKKKRGDGTSFLCPNTQGQLHVIALLNDP